MVPGIAAGLGAGAFWGTTFVAPVLAPGFGSVDITVGRFLACGLFALALLLFQNTGRLMSRDHLRETVWGQNAEVLSRTLDTHVSRLRQVLQLRPGNAYSIAAVYGLGYRLDRHES